MSPVRKRLRRHPLHGLRRKSVLIGAACVAALVAVGVLWCGWTAYRVYDDLKAAEEQARVLKASLARGDVAGASAAAERFREASRNAANRTDGLAWGVIEAMPLLGDDAEGLAIVSTVLTDIGARGVPPLVESAANLNAGSYAPSGHQFPLEEIAALEAPAAISHGVFADAAAELGAVDSDTFASPVRKAFDDLRNQVGEGATILDTAERAARLMPTLLGADGPRDYLMIFQNNAEIRAMGGLPGTMSLIHAEDGRVDITRQEAAGPMGELDRPVLPLSPDEEELFGRQLGTYFLDANFTPDLPRAAELWRARWRVETKTDIDGVMVVDPVAMSYLLQAARPLRVEGRTLTAENIVAETEHLAYLRYDQARQDGFFNAVANAAFDVFADGRGDQVGMVEGLARGVIERRILIHSFQPAEQTLIADTMIAGELPDGSGANPHVGVYLNSGTAAKLSYFLDYDVQVTSASCRDGRQQLVSRLQITSDTPNGVTDMPDTVVGFEPRTLPRGTQLVVADLFAPVRGAFSGVEIDGDVLRDPAVDSHGGRAVISVGLDLAPGQSRVVTWTMATGPDQTGPIDVSVTPGARAENESSVAPSTC